MLLYVSRFLWGTMTALHSSTCLLTPYLDWLESPEATAAVNRDFQSLENLRTVLGVKSMRALETQGMVSSKDG